MKTATRLSVLCTGLLAPLAITAQVTENASYSVGLPIPDNDASGLAVTATFSSLQIYEITDLEVQLAVSGGFNGDYYAYLTHDAGFSVLLNRVGRDASTAFGYPDAGFDVLLDDEAANGDIHAYRTTLNPNGGVLTGTWAPDARIEDPSSVLDTSPRLARLDSFAGLDPNGDWTLFVADLDPGSSGVLQGWGLAVTGIPEPSVAAMLLIGAGTLTFRRLARFQPRETAAS